MVGYITEAIISDMETEITRIIDLLKKLPDNLNIQKSAIQYEADEIKREIMTLSARLK